MRKILLFALFATHAVAEPPNILYIISDDMGYSDLGCYGGEIKTPVLDALAAQGVRFTNYYVSNMCWPTRASIMTGLYPNTALNRGGTNGGLDPASTTLPEHLQKAGYATLMAGKWHLSNPAEPNGKSAPHKRGFDQFYGTIHGASDFFAPVGLQLNGKDVTHEWRDNPDYFYSDAIADYSIKFIKDVPSEKPFFMYMAFTSAHWPLHAKPEDIKKYKGMYKMGWDKLRDERYARMQKMGLIDATYRLSPRHPEVPAWDVEKHKDWQERRMEVYAAQVTNMDWNIGRVVEFLKGSGRYDNTLIIYQHDNGGCQVEYTTKRKGSWSREFTTDGNKVPVKSGNIPGVMPGPQSTFQSYGYGWANASNTPFRLFKQHDHEGGIRSPLIASWPAKLRKSMSGGFVNHLSHVVDIMPTFLDAAGVYSSGKVVQKPLPLEGQSFLNTFATTKAHSVKPRDGLFWAHAKGRAVRIQNWKLVSKNRQSWELYDLSKDPTELEDLSGNMPEKVAEMEKRFAHWEKRTKVRNK